MKNESNNEIGRQVDGQKSIGEPSVAALLNTPLELAVVGSTDISKGGSESKLAGRVTFSTSNG